MVQTLITTSLVVVSVIFPVLAFIAIVLRLKARHLGTETFRADDWWVLVAWIFSLGESISVWVFSGLVGVNYYRGSEAKGEEQSRQSIFASILMLQIAVAAVKFSLLLFYMRIFSTIKKFKYAAWGMMGVVAVWCVLFFLLIVFENSPVSASWTGEGHPNFDVSAMSLAQVGSSFVLDLIVIVMPLPLIANLHLSTKRKIQVAGIFSLGLFCCVCAIVRLALQDEVIRQVTSSAGYDGISLDNYVYIFMILESNCSVIGVCLPCYMPLLRNEEIRKRLNNIKSVMSLESLRSSVASLRSSSKGSQSGSQIEKPLESPMTVTPHSSQPPSQYHDQEELRDSIQVTRSYDVAPVQH